MKQSQEIFRIYIADGCMRRYSSASTIQKIDRLRKPGVGIFVFLREEGSPGGALRGVEKMIVAFSVQASYR